MTSRRRGDVEPAQRLAELAELARQVTQAEGAAICAITASQHRVLVTSPPSFPALDTDVLCDALARSNDPTVVVDARGDPRAGRAASSTRCFAATRLELPGGAGALCVMASSPRDLSAKERETLALLAGQVEALLELVHRNDELEAVRSQLADAVEVGSIVMWRRPLPDGDATWIGSVERLLGMPPGTFDGRSETVHSRIHPEDLANLLARREPYLRDGGEAQAECRILGLDGRTRHAHIRYRVALRDGVPVTSYGTLVDISELRERELRLEQVLAQLRALTARVHGVREEEAQRIARGLHDEIGQELTALKLDASWLVRRVDGAEVKTRLADMIGQIDKMMNLVRQLATELRPQLLDELGLAAAIRWLLRELEQRTNLCYVVDLPSAPLEISPEASVALFRVLQEALTNVTRHANARTVEVSLAVEGDSAVMTVRDDGRGMPSTLPPGSLGLLGMRERMLSVGGTLVVGPAVDVGTVVTATVPIP